jgi:hypothetical protein
MQCLMDYLAAIEADPRGPDAVVSVLADTARAVHALAALGEEGDLDIGGLNELLARCVQTMNAALDLHYGHELPPDCEALSPDEMFAALDDAALRRELDDDPTLSSDGALVLDSIRRGLVSALST